MTILDGKGTAQEIRKELKEKVESLKNNGERPPHLAAVLVGDDGPSHTYVNAKVKDCRQIGYESTLVDLPATISEKDLLDKVDQLNNDDNIDGFIVQLPLPDHIDENEIIAAINPNKDVDGFHPENFGRMALNLPSFISATPRGIVELLDRYDIETEGKHCVVIGRSNIVGTPISILMSRNNKVGNATVTVTHSRTKNLKEITQQADIVIAAIGNPYFLKAEMVKEGAVVIDVGMSRVEDASKKRGYRLAGDVDFDKVKEKASHITPVPGGVGPMTRAALLLNTFRAYSIKK
ncbi:bifunctional methylenetetrahydrofolate dehydrogenase/methenyltetrahydrofolate cyclohydrolase FolD [Salibacter halophilus]|uniref:Bifunctional protein FolD n=1 Tax=Salibacter halophilus TaxID=1803916 RepID=A0A6N6M7W4_9FLAO|nr:bifunctional methylenetetrahydrofolate dehydrogenase/methenyltetrahydrofolate cyclohydrolase FolD [Salibacter halophilus]KAB1064841.1 bifunctional methylenetetrahydrofolate dehydrogenase/methenyltetrahydrofolate cyclohydrolase FolD [Salibacter halophilus]